MGRLTGVGSRHRSLFTDDRSLFTVHNKEVCMSAHATESAVKERPQGLIVLQGNRMEDLRDVTMAWLSHRPLHPLEKTTFLVQSNGIAQWLKTSMAETQGVAGRGISLGADVMLPARFQWQAYRQVIEAVEGEGSVPATSPFDKAQLRWQLLNLLPGLLDDPRFAPLARYLADDPDTRKRYQLAERIADLFDQYQVYRADWLSAWEQGKDILPRSAFSAAKANEPLDEEHLWQPALWRMLGDAIAEHLSETARQSHRGAVHQRFSAAASQLTQRPVGLAPRLVVFGISSLPQQMLDVLAALSPFTEVILCLLNPCQHYWGDIIETREVLRRHHRQRRKQGMPADLQASPEALHLHAHPLLAAWGKQGRDYLHLLGEHDDTERYRDAFTALQQPVDCFVTPDTRHLLGQLQDDILDLRPLAESQARWPVLAPDDRSIAFHACHGPQRELEVLHDQLLAAFAEDATLQPRDIMVMVPDINDYAPYIEAVFGQFSPFEPRYLPYHIADQQRRHRAPLLVALETLLSLPQLRFRASEVLDLLDIPPLRYAFGLEEGDMATLQRWIHDANIRWGLHAKQRAALGLPEHDDLHTWRFGLERMLMGYAVGEPDSSGDDWEGIVPFDEVAGLDARLVGSLYRLIRTLDSYRERLDITQDAETWATTLGQLLTDTLAPTTAQEEQLLGQVQTALENWAQEIQGANVALELNLAIVRESWLARIDEPQLAQNFIVGRVTFATLMPMRAIPFRQVYMLGMQDGAYPRKSEAPDFDLMAIRGHYRPGDRSRRDDDRYLFLEALLSARERLVISWCGFSVQDNREQPPSVLIGQLRDHLAAGWQLPEQVDPASLSVRQREKHQQALLKTLTTAHPLQPFGHAYFDAASPLFTYAREWQEVRHGTEHNRLHANEVYENKTHDRASKNTRLPLWQPEGSITLSALIGLLRDPVGALFQQRLSTTMHDDRAESEDDEPFAFEGLSKWQQREAMLQPLGQRAASEREADIDTLFAQAEEQRQRAGDYPPAPVGPIMRHALLERLPATLGAYREQLRRFPKVRQPAPAITHQCHVHLADHPSPVTITLEDTLDHVYQGDTHAARVVLLTSQVHQGDHWHWAQITRHWPAHLALQLALPGSVTLLVSPSGTLEIPGMPAETAAAWLDALIAQWLGAMQAPLPTYPSLAFAMLDHLKPAPNTRLDIDRLYEDAELMGEWKKAFETLAERSPLTLRELPTLADFFACDDFLPACQALYGDLHHWITTTKETP
jgi:exodeoxyribonuclease V gamma subunit